jgi:hypothetical protein
METCCGLHLRSADFCCRRHGTLAMAMAMVVSRAGNGRVRARAGEAWPLGERGEDSMAPCLPRELLHHRHEVVRICVDHIRRPGLVDRRLPVQLLRIRMPGYGVPPPVPILRLLNLQRRRPFSLRRSLHRRRDFANFAKNRSSPPLDAHQRLLLERLHLDP